MSAGMARGQADGGEVSDGAAAGRRRDRPGVGFEPGDDTIGPEDFRRDLIAARGAHVKRGRILDGTDGPAIRALPGESGRGQRAAGRLG